MRVLVLVLVLVLVPGCSYLLMQRAPVAARPGDRPDCTESPVPSYIDFAVAAASALASVALYTGFAKHSMTDANGMTTERDLTTAERELYGTAALVEGIGFAGSGLYGTWRSGQCREFLAKLPAPAPGAMP